MNQINYKNFDKFILRTPLFPFQKINSINDDSILELFTDKVFQEAIYIASPPLYEEMLKLINGEITKEKEIEKLKFSLIKYYIRMSTRCTPFGLFSACSIGTIIQSENIQELLPDYTNARRHTRLDMNYLCALSQDLVKNPLIREKLLFFPNSSIYKLGDKLRYVEYKYQNSNRVHHIAAVDNSTYLEEILQTAENGVFIKDLIKLLVCDEITKEEAHEFIEELVNSQILISELEPIVTGKEYLEQIINVITRIFKNEASNHEFTNLIDTLKKANNLLIAIDNEPLGINTKPYNKIIANLDKLNTKYDVKFLFQTDLSKDHSKLSIQQNLVNKVYQSLRILNKLTFHYPESNLSRFCDAFYERFEEAEIPLLKALDTESGIGYLQNTDTGDHNPLIGDIALPFTGSSASQFSWNSFHHLLFNKYNQVIEKNGFELELTDSDLKDYKENWEDLPDTISAMIEVMDDKIYVNNAGGSSAANLLGRFCFANDEIYEYVKDITIKEEKLHPNEILAEIAHLPQSRTGNILARPLLRKYEIPYLAKPFVNKEYQIDVNDLMISVKNRKVILRSKKLNKVIIPHLTNAHNYSYNALPVYQFLCDIQSQGYRGSIGFYWPSPLDNRPFLPRVMYKDIILSYASWLVKKDELKDIINIKDNTKLLSQFEIWRKERNIPIQVVLEDGDNKLYFRFDNALMMKTLFSVISNRSVFKLQEFPYKEETSFVKGENGSYTNQFILSFYKEFKSNN